LNPPPVGSDLCLACGLCCDGTLFARVPLGSEEAGPARALGLAVTEGAQGASFAQPCPLFREGCCSVYGRTPQPCVRFRCRLLDRFLAGAVPLEEGLRIVARARNLRDGLRERLASRLDPAHGLAGWMEELGPAGQDEAATGCQAELGALAYYLQIHFRGPRA